MIESTGAQWLLNFSYIDHASKGHACSPKSRIFALFSSFHRTIVRQHEGNYDLLLKSLGNKKNLNDVTAAPFFVFLLLLVAEKKTPKTGVL